MILADSLLRTIARSGKSPAIVVGTDITGTAVARALAGAGVPVIGVDDRVRRYTSHSRAYAAHHVMPDGFREPAIITELERIADQLPCKAALFLSMDHHVTIIGAHGQHLRERFAFDFPQNASVELLMDKQRFAAFAEQHQWPLPRTYTCNSAAEIVNVAGQATFPVLLKPKVKTPVFARHSEAKVYRCDTPEHLLEIYGMVCQWETGVIVQEWIPGGDDEVYFSFHYLSQDGGEIGSFEGRKLRQFPPLCGNTTAAVPVAQPRLRQQSLEILRAAGAAGFCAVEYKRDPRSDVFYVTEPTIGRVNLQIGTAIANGINLPLMAYRHLLKLPALAVSRPRRPRTWIHLSRDIASARYYISKGELTWPRYLASLAGPRSYAAWRWTEFRMAAELTSHAAHYASRRSRIPPVAWFLASLGAAAALFI